MKILFLQDDFPPHAKGGAGIVAATFARALAARGHELTVVTAVQDRTLAGTFYEDGLRVERIYSKYALRWRSWLSLYNPMVVPQLKQIFAEVQPDVVHAHNVHVHLSYWALRLAKKNGAKVFLTAHDAMLFHYSKLKEFVNPKQFECKKTWDYRVSPWQQLWMFRFWYNPFRNIVIRYSLRYVDKALAVSGALKNALVQNGIKNVEVLHNGIDVEKWQNVQEETVDAFIKRYELVGKKVILFGGRISASKGGRIILSLLQKVLETEPKAALLLLGKHDDYTEGLLEQARHMGIYKHIVLTGWLTGDELLAANHVADVVVAPSLYLDPLPTVVLEAMACGKPIVGSCLGGIPEMVIDEETGYIVNPYDTAVFAERISKIFANKQVQKLLGERGHARVQKEFSLTTWCDRILAIYGFSRS